VSGIRSLRPDDLEGVAALYERVVRSGSSAPAPGLVEQFERTLLGHPWVDPEIPSLVYEDDGSGIVGMLGSHPRRLRLGSRELRLACSGQLTADPDFQRRGVGALLLRRYLAGPQDLTTTDGATDTVRAMWQGLGGTTNGLASMSWTRVFRPASFAAAVVERRRGSPLPGRSFAEVADRLAARPLRVPGPGPRVEELTTAALRDLLDDLPFELRPAYDEPFLDWLFEELGAVRARGSLRRRVVLDAGERAAGFFVYHLQPGGLSQLLAVGCAERDAPLVLDTLFFEASSGGAAAVSGRVEPHLHAALRERRCLFRRGEWALVHGDADALAALFAGRALLTRLEGEWWMGHHLS
jgi:hypothetical protein